MGRTIKHLPSDINEVYDEIRTSIKNNCYTAAILLGRKLIMHLSVSQANTKPNSNFAKHIKAIKDNGYIPPNANKLLEFIRKNGNEQNHQIVLAKAEVAEKMLKFVEALLIFCYELPNEFDDDESQDTGQQKTQPVS